jgi:hypothetical protein
MFFNGSRDLRRIKAFPRNCLIRAISIAPVIIRKKDNAMPKTPRLGNDARDAQSRIKHKNSPR